MSRAPKKRAPGADDAAVSQPAPPARKRAPPGNQALLRTDAENEGSENAGAPAGVTIDKSPVVQIRLNLASNRATFVTAAKTEYAGNGYTDLEPGSYRLRPEFRNKRWIVKPSPPGLRFHVELDTADPWQLTYVSAPQLVVEAGGIADKPIGYDLDDTVAVEGDPATNSKYFQNAFAGVGIFGWGGPFRLDRKIVNGHGTDSIVMSRDQVHLDDDPLKDFSIAINKVYKTRAAAEAAVAEYGRPGTYAYYIGPDGYIYPTVISDTTAPALCQSLRKAIEMERADAKAAADLSVHLLLWYVGARFPMQASEGAAAKPPPAPQAGGAAGQAAGASKTPYTIVEIGAGDLKASIEVAKKGQGQGVKVIAVDPEAPAAAAIKELEAAGGTFVEGTAKNLSPGTADHVFQYFPYRITGSGSFVTGGTWELVQRTIQLLKPNGAAHFVSEEYATATHLAEMASKHGLRATVIETTAGAAAPGASGAGVPNFTSETVVWLVNIYK